MVRSSCLFLLLIIAAACGSNSSGSGPCDVVPPDPACDLACDPLPGAPASCPDGFYCNPDGKCDAQCTQAGDQCGSGYVCTYDGHCQPGEPEPGDDAGMDCPRVAFMAKPVTPSILLVIDRSGSMREGFGNPSVEKWSAVRNALVDPATGVVTQLESKAYFGAMIYDTADATCPRLGNTPRALNNAATIRTALMTNPSQNGSTPTAKTLAAAVASFTATPPPAGSPPIIVLATDGEPRSCNDEANPPTPQARVVTAAAAAFAAKIKVIPLSVGNAIGEAHLQDVANAGAGVTAGMPNAPFYKGNNPAELKTAFDNIIGGVVSCDLTVNASVSQEQAAQAVIRLNGRALLFGTDWELVGDRTIRILGASCTEMKAAAMPAVEGTFPCGVVLE